MGNLGRFFEMGDVARRAGISKSTALFDMARGVLSVSAFTLRGVRLFTEEDVTAYLKAREARAAQRTR